MWKGKRVLVVDDSQMAQKVLQTILSGEDASVDLASTGKDGLSLWQSRKYDMVLIDLFLPDIFGLEMVRRMRSDDQEVCLVVITAHGNLDSAVEALREGADGYVEKDLITAQGGISDFLQRLERSAKLRAETAARLRLERQLEDERDRLRQTLFGLDEFVIAMDSDLNVHLMNPKAREMLGIHEEAVTPIPISSLRLPGEIVSAIKRVEGSGRMEDGEIEWDNTIYLMRVYPIHSRDRRVEGSICVLRDVTERRRLERLRRHFYSMATHDLKAPLSVIVAYADYLKEGMAGELTPDQKKMVGIILESANRMTNMVVKFLDHFYISEGNLSFNWEAVDLIKMLSEMVKGMSMVANSKGVTLQWRHEIDHAKVWADLHYLERAFSNVLENAIKYTPEGGRVTVSLKPESEGYMVGIEDTGPGIPKDVLPVIFRPYERGESKATKNKDGIGLGLYTAHEVINEAHGRIDVESETGKGTTFRIWLPTLERGKALQNAVP
ncbi:MAG: response regulator [Nitrospiraceae bacterium]|nr:response regulator [Nitrospiraceae bacterium]